MESYEHLVRQGKLKRVFPTTDTGWKRYGPGRQFLSSGGNYLTNPSFELDTNSDGQADGVTVSNIQGTKTVTLVAGRLSGYAQRVQYVGAAADSGTWPYPILVQTSAASFASGDKALFSFYAKGAVSGCNLVVEITSRTSGDTWVTITSAALTLTTSWARYSLLSNTLGANTDHVHVGVYVSGDLHNGDTVDISVDDAMVEKASVLGDYFDGTYPDCMWDGTKNASTSRRTSSSLKYPLSGGLSSSGGTIALRQLIGTAAGGTADLFFANKTAGTGTGINLYTSATGTYLYVANAASYKQVIITTTSPRVLGANSSVVARVWADTIDLNKDGVAATQVTGLTAPVFVTPITIGPFTNAGFDYIGPLVLSPTRWSDADVANFQTNRSVLWSSPIVLYRWLKTHGYINSIIFPLQSNSVGYQVM